MRKLRKAKALASLATFAMIAALLVPLFSQPALAAQATTGSIRGAVTDQTGAVVPDATIVAKNQNTGVESAPFKTTSDGIYNIPNLNPGTYTLTVEAANFKRAAFTDIEVRVGQEVTIDAALQPGGLTETVTVAAGSEEVVNRETAQVSANFEARKVAELPSNAAGGGIDTLALLAPGVVPGVAGNSNGTTLSVNGNRSRSNNFTIDGQDNNDLAVAGPAFFVDNLDVVADFQVVTNNFSAQYGRNQGAIINIVTKSGTNDLHGSAFWFHRDQKLFDSLTNIERRSGQEEALPLLSNIYGFTVGGPILKDRAFFFGSFQGIKQRQSVIARGAGLALLPSEFDRIKATFPGNAAIQVLADFGAFAITDFGQVQPRTDLANAFGVITLPRNPALPATGANAVTFQAAFPERTFSLPFDQDEYTIRGDVKASEKDNIWASFLYQDAVSGNALGGSNGFTGDIPNVNKKFGATWNRQLSGTALNSFFFSYGRLFVSFGGGCEGLKGCIPDITAIDTAFSNVNFGGVRTTSGAVGALQAVGGATNLPQGRIVQTYQFSDTVSMTRGRHQLTMGADIRRLINESTVLFDFNGTYTGFTAARLAANNPGTITFAAGEPTIGYNETDQFYFIQDDWKARDNLTLNIGLRYEYTGQPVNTLHELTLARESNPQEAFFRQSLPVESRIVPKFQGDKNNFAPRIGFAWTPRFGNNDGFMGRLLGEDATVIRGGYGIAYDPAFYNILIFLSTSTPTVFNQTIVNPATPTAANPIVFPVPNGMPTAGGTQGFALDNGLIARNVIDPRLLNQSVLPGDFHSPYSQQWSFGIQRQIGRSNVFEVRYLGTHGVGLFQNRDANPRIDRLLNGFTAVAGGQTIQFPGFPNLVPAGLTPVTCVNNPATPDNEAACNGRILAGRGIITETGNHGQSLYHSLQSRYNGRLWNQLTLGSAYTWSKALDTSSEVIGLGSAGSLSQDPFNITSSERSYAAFDRRHVFSLNGIWDIPAFKDQKGIVGHLLGGWQINSVYLISSGFRYTVANNLNIQLNARGLPVYSQQITADRSRPFYGNIDAPRDTVAITGIDALLSQTVAPFFTNVVGITPTTDLYLLNDLNNGIVTRTTRDAVRFILNGPGSALLFNNPFGTVPRNSEVGPRINQVNAGFFKNTRISERFNLQFRTEIFNLFNHPQPGYGTTFVNGTFPDRIALDAGFQDGFNDFGGIEFARRVIQLGLRLTF
jgi:outer membrane receptor protein involved in Fe transport